MTEAIPIPEYGGNILNHDLYGLQHINVVKSKEVANNGNNK